MNMPTQPETGTPLVPDGRPSSAKRSTWFQTHKVSLAFIALALLLPVVAKDFMVFQVTQLLVYAIAIIGLNLLMGFNGQFSLGHSTFFAIGAYSAAILMERFGVPYAWTLPLAGLISFIFGVMFGLPASRLEGVYLAGATFALAFATPQLLKLTPMQPWTGGWQGKVLDKPDVPFGLPMNADQWLYYFVLIVTVILYVCAKNLVVSRTGRAMLAIKDNPVSATAMGINTSFYKTLTFGVSAAYTGIAGALGALVVQFVSPESFTFNLAVALLVGLIVGGIGWLPGAFFGAAFVLFVPNIAEGISKGLSGAVYGVLLILLIYVMPLGAGGMVAAIRRRFTDRKR